MIDEDLYDDNTYEKMRLLPAWFCERMLGAAGSYAFVLEGGVTVIVSRILALHQDGAGGIWLDVSLLDLSQDQIDTLPAAGKNPVITATGAHNKATLNARAIMMAYELNIAKPEETPHV